MFDSPAFALFVLAVIFFVGWYAVGTQYNVRLGSNAMKWLQQGLKLVGERATLRWLGSSVVELKMAKAKEPFRSAEVLVVMEPRDVPIMWLWGHLQGRRDLIIFRTQLRAAPSFDLEAHGSRVWSSALPREDMSNWSSLPVGAANNMRVKYQGNVSPAQINDLISLASRDGVELMRLAVHRTVPNLELHFLLPKFDQVSPPGVFTSLRRLSEEVLRI